MNKLDIIKKLKVGDKIKFTNPHTGTEKWIYGTVKCLGNKRTDNIFLNGKCKDRICIIRDDGYVGLGCNRKWFLFKTGDNWKRITLLKSNPNNDIIIKEE